MNLLVMYLITKNITEHDFQKDNISYLDFFVNIQRLYFMDIQNIFLGGLYICPFIQM